MRRLTLEEVTSMYAARPKRKGRRQSPERLRVLAAALGSANLGEAVIFSADEMILWDNASGANNDPDQVRSRFLGALRRNLKEHGVANYVYFATVHGDIAGKAEKRDVKPVGVRQVRDSEMVNGGKK